MAPFLLEAATIQGIFEAGPAAFLKLDQPALALARAPLPYNLNGLVNHIQTIKRLCYSTGTVVTAAQQLRAARFFEAAGILHCDTRTGVILCYAYAVTAFSD